MNSIVTLKENFAILGERRVTVAEIPRFHVLMATACVTTLLFSIAGCMATSIRVPNSGDLWIAVALATAAALPLPLYWHEKGQSELRDAALTVPWGLMLAVLLPFPVSVAARLGMGHPLADSHLAAIDQALDVSVPAIASWGEHHWLGHLANKTYPFLIPLIPIAFFLAAFSGRVKQAQQFLTSNLFAFALGLPLFSLFPAVGPWFGYHFVARLDQAACQAGLLSIRDPILYVFHPDGIVCFPSFHVIWAILCARALWGFKVLRVPAFLLASLIILSTLTTAWHYFADVVGGCLVAFSAILLSTLLDQWTNKKNAREA